MKECSRIGPGSIIEMISWGFKLFTLRINGAVSYWSIMILSEMIVIDHDKYGHEIEWF